MKYQVLLCFPGFLPAPVRLRPQLKIEKNEWNFQDCFFQNTIKHKFSEKLEEEKYGGESLIRSSSFAN